MKQIPKTVRHNHKTYDVKGSHSIRGETYLVIGKYGRGDKSIDHVLHVTGRNQFKDRVVHVLEGSSENWKQFQNLDRAAGKSLPFARILTHVKKDGKLCVVVEHQAGKSLRYYLKTGREISPYKALMLNRQLVGQVANLSRTTHVHHGDISPDNIVVARDVTRLVLIDFGSSFTYSESNRLSTGDGIKQIYAAPEVINGKPPNRISEQFSCGMILNEILTGEIAYSGRGGTVVQGKQNPDFQPRIKPILEYEKNVEAKFPKHIWPEVDAYLKVVLAVDPRKRFSTLNAWQASAKKLAWLTEPENQPHFQKGTLEKSLSSIAKWIRNI